MTNKEKLEAVFSVYDGIKIWLPVGGRSYYNDSGEQERYKATIVLP